MFLSAVSPRVLLILNPRGIAGGLGKRLGVCVTNFEDNKDAILG